MTAPCRRAAATLAAALCLLGACVPEQQRSTPADLAALEACRERADEVYQKQNREDVYRSDVFATSSRDAPYAATGLPGVTSRGLSAEYQRENLVSDCLNAGATARPANAPAQPAGGTSSGFAPPGQLP